MKKMKRPATLLLPAIALITNLSLLSDAQTPAQAEGAAEAKAKVAMLLELTDNKYRKIQDNVWVVEYQGNQMATVPVLVSSAPNFVVAGVVVAKKAQMKPTADFLYKLLKLSYNYDLVKISLDRDDDLFVGVELKIKTLDGEEFKAYLKTVATAADAIYGQIKPMIDAK
jgi:hypothetical protein